MFQRIWAIMQKEFIQTLRDRRTLLIQLGLPIAQLFIFGYAIRMNVEHVPMAVADQSLDAARQDVVRAKIANIETALVRFRIDCGRYPDEAEGLRVLITAPANLGDTWQGPYLKQPELVDPWGNPYVYVEQGTVNPDGFDLLSYGADGKAGGAGGDADIYNRKR